MKQFFRKISALTDTLIVFARNNPVSIASATGILIGSTFLRAFLENYSNPELFGGFTAWYTVLGFFLYFTGVVLMLAIFLNWIFKQTDRTVFSLLIISLPVLFTAPIFDLVISGGSGYCMAYLADNGWKLVADFFTFFGPFQYCGISPGLRFEIVLILIGVGILGYKVTKSALRTAIGVVGSYAIIFANLSVSGIIVTIAHGFSWTGSLAVFFGNMMQKSLLVTTQVYISTSNVLIQNYAAGSIFTSRISWIICAVAIPLLWYQQNSIAFKAYFKDIRWARIAYYASIGLFGMYLALHFSGPYSAIPHTLPDVLGYIIFFAVIAFGFTFAAATNDIVDVPIDVISNAHRPLASGMLDSSQYKNIAVVLGILILSGSLLINYDFFICTMIFHTCFYFYSIPPLRLKRHFFSGGMLLALAGVATLMAGFFFFSTALAFDVIPLSFLVCIFLFLFIIVHIRDFKDIPGDAHEGIKTLPVVFGEKKARRMIACAILVGGIFLGLSLCISFPLFSIALWILSIAFFLTMFFRKVDERIAFAFMYVTVIAAILLL